MLKHERFLDIDGEKIFKEDIEKMNAKEIHQLCAFLETKSELEWVAQYCCEMGQVIINNILIKLTKKK